MVTGGNRGIGLEICRQLASNGVLVVLTARDEKKGSQAVEELQGSGLSGVILHDARLVEPRSGRSPIEAARRPSNLHRLSGCL